jgi:flavodoxin
MKALIVYASWFGHNRAIARALAAALAFRGFDVHGAPVTKVGADDVAGYDVLILGTFTHGGRASDRLREFCEAIPLRVFDRVAVAIFGTQMLETQQEGLPSGAHELETALAERGVELALPPLVIALPSVAAFRRISALGTDDRRRVEDFTDELWEASVPAPI